MEPLRNLRDWFRIWRRAPILAGVISLTLAAGIGVGVTVFNLVDALLFRPVSRAVDPERIVAVFTSENGSTPQVSSWRDFLDLRVQNDTFETLAAYKTLAMDLAADERSDRIRGGMVSSDFFRVFGLRPQKGRFFTPSEDAVPLRDAVAVLSDAAWRSRFGADPGIVGRTLLLNGRSFRVIGVAPRGFRGATMMDPPEVYVSMMMQPLFMASSGNLLEKRGWSGVYIVGRLRRGVSMSRAQANLSTIASALAAEYRATNGSRRVVTVPFAKASLPPALRAKVAKYSAMLLLTVGLVLILVCANVAGLLQARTVSRRKEIAIRRALGAGGWRVSAGVLGESLGLAAVGAALGVALAAWSARLVPSLFPATLSIDPTLGGRTLGVALVATLGCGVLCGAIPAFLVARRTSPHRLGDAGNRQVPGFSRPLAALVTVQVAVSLVLLVAAGLFVRTLLALRETALGFETHGVAVGTIDPAMRGFDTAAQGRLVRDVADRLLQSGEISEVAFSNILPLSGEGDTWGVWTDDAPADQPKIASIQAVTGDFFDLFRIPIREGRAFGDEGEAGMPMVVSESLAEYLWPGRDPIGERLRFDAEGTMVGTVVGVAGNAKSESLRGRPERMLYLSFYAGLQAGQSMSPVQIFARSDIGAAAVIPVMEDAVASLAGGLPLTDVHTLAAQVDQAMAPERLSAAAMLAAGLTGILLAAIGLYGLLSFFVARATSEIGVRMALGASAPEIATLVVRRSIVPLGIGIVAGLGGAIGVTRFLKPFLFEVNPADAASFGLAIGVVVLVAAIAGSIPASRAVRISPVEALRVE